MAQETTTQNQRGSKSSGKFQAGNKGMSGGNVSDDQGIREQVMTTARETLGNVSDKAGEYIDRASDYFEGFNANPGTFIRNYPVQAAIGGVIVGFLLGAAVSRRTLA
jgi:hypothetical protein